MNTYHAAIRRHDYDEEPNFIINAAMDHWVGIRIGTAARTIGECIRLVEESLIKDYPGGVLPSRITYPPAMLCIG